MKKQFTIAALAVASLTAAAQTTTKVPNRVLIQSGYDVKGYATDNIDSIYFDRIDGDVKADINFKGYSDESGTQTIKVSVTRTPDCASFVIDVMAANTAKNYDDKTMATWFSRQNVTPFTEDFSEGALTGFSELQAGTEYTIITLGYDKYGVAGQTSRVNFTTPNAQIVGNPKVSWNIDEVTPTSFTLTVTPNEDTSSFYWCMFGKGELQQQFEQWGPMFGFDNVEQMIAQFSGQAYVTKTKETWKDLQPDTEYEVDVVPVDANGNYGEMQTIPVKTAKNGGEGIASVTITYDGIGGDATNGYHLDVTYTPNDQTSVHHDLLIEKEYFDKNFTDESIKAAMSSDENPFGYDPYWNSIGTESVSWNFDEGKTYYALAVAKNMNGEYGPLAKLEINTTATKSAAKKAPKTSLGVAKRVVNKKNAVKNAVVPVINNGGIKLTNTK